jgi:O-antigen ligase
MAVVVPTLALYTPMFEGILYRFGRIGPQASGTILLRLSLWKAALTAFWNNPILGIGAGNFAIVYNWVPTVRFDPIFFWVSGMSTHSVLMTSLAETGILGFLTMYFYFGRGLKLAWGHLKKAVETDQVTTAHILFIAVLVIVGSSLYGGSWFWGNNSYHMAVIFGLVASYRHRLDVTDEEGHGR